MAVIREFALPDLGEGLTGAEIVRWLVQVGDVVAVDQPVAEVETAKASVEVPCPYGGVVTARFGDEGSELAVGAPLLTVAVQDADGTDAGPTVADGAEAVGPAAGAGAAGTGAPSTGVAGTRAAGTDVAGTGAVAAGGGWPDGAGSGAGAPEGSPGPEGVGTGGSANGDSPRSGSPTGDQDGGRDGGSARDPGGAGHPGSSGNVLVGYGTGAPPPRRRRASRARGPRSAGRGAGVGTARSVGTAGGGGAEGGGAGTAVAAGCVGTTGVAGAAGGAGTAAAAAPLAAVGTAPAAEGTTAGAGGTAEGALAVGEAAAARPDHLSRVPPEGGAGPGGGLTGSAPGPVATTTRPLAVISPLVRRLAREHGLDLREVAGSGPEGLILRADVERAVRQAAVAAERSVPRDALPVGSAPEGAVAPEATPAVAGTPPAGRETAAPGTSVSGAVGTGSEAGAEQRIPLRGIRGATAEKLARSRREIPDATCWVDADATELLAARAAMNAVEGPKVSLLALLARICTAALTRYPDLNATVDTEDRCVVRLPAVHLGFAAQTDRGLVVPVVRDAHTRGAAELSAEMARLTEAARAGGLTPAELTGGTFTLNNYGVFGVDGSTPIINHPEAAMLGVGRISAKPWVHQGELAVRQVVQLSFTFDHRVCDGGTAGGFLRYVADCVEHPAVLLRSL